MTIIPDIYPIGGILFAITKGFWETFRVHESEFERNYLDTGWTLWQFWLLALFIGCVIWIAIVIKKKRKRQPQRLPSRRKRKVKRGDNHEDRRY